MPFENQIEMAWAATLFLLVLTANFIASSFRGAEASAWTMTGWP
jgi:hypothetical protein